MGSIGRRPWLLVPRNSNGGAEGARTVTVRALVVKRLGALPVIVDYLERLQVKERVDALAPVRQVAHLTNGEVVAALVANRLTAPRPL